MSFGPKTIEEARVYKYGAWAGRPSGKKYDPARCMASVSPSVRGAISHQCQKKIWKDGFCKQHHPDTIEAKNDAREQKWQEESERNRRKWALQSAAPDMLAALELALEVIEATGPGAYPEAEKQIWDAVSKAKGES